MSLVSFEAMKRKQNLETIRDYEQQITNRECVSEYNTIHFTFLMKYNGVKDKRHKFHLRHNTLTSTKRQIEI